MLCQCQINEDMPAKGIHSTAHPGSAQRVLHVDAFVFCFDSGTESFQNSRSATDFVYPSATNSVVYRTPCSSERTDEQNSDAL